MGQVIAIHSAPQGGPHQDESDAHVQAVEEFFSSFELKAGLRIREGQKQLAVAVRKSLLRQTPTLLAEAPTGTGKTISYLAGALSAAREVEASGGGAVPVVVATATVALQAQMLLRDIPALQKAGALGKFDTSVAKGRQRYFCIATAEALARQKTSQVDMFDDASAVMAHDPAELDNLLSHWHAQAWDGDIDNFGEESPKVWPLVRADAKSCTGKACDYYETCPYFAARKKLSFSRLVIANQDLVLSDLASRGADEDGIFGNRFFLVVDEGHHLPTRAVAAASANLDFSDLLEACAHIGASKAWASSPEFLKILHAMGADVSDFESANIRAGLEKVQGMAEALSFDPTTHEHVFESGLGGLDSQVRALQSIAEDQGKIVDQALSKLKSSALMRKEDFRLKIQAVLQATSALVSVLDAVRKNTATLLDTVTDTVRWAEKSPRKPAVLRAAALDSGEILRKLLWETKPDVRTVIVSATLQDFTGFEQVVQRMGLDNVRTLALPSTFPYRENVIYLPQLEHSPRQETRAKWLAEVQEQLPLFIDPEEGTLVLCPSYEVLRQVSSSLKKQFGLTVLVQGSKSVRQLVKDHCHRVDEGKGSILCGVATLSEGLDLPGSYCSHVVILALPFSPPTSAVERTIQKRMGKQYFGKRALPDAFFKLVQMVGRLMRRETDRGRITVFDTRLNQTQWGMSMLRKLPPFRIEYLEKKRTALNKD